MQILRSSNNIPSHLQQSVLIIGNFDGIHKGHQYLISEALQYAKSINKYCCVLTFSPHPNHFFKEKNTTKLILNNEDKIKSLEKLGVKSLFIADFDHHLAKLSPESFVQQVLIDWLKVNAVFTGSNFHFGKNASGNIQDLGKILQSYQVYFKSIKPLIIDKQICSCSLIRNMVESDQINQVKYFLGQNFFLRGTVIHGNKKGRGFGFPTINLSTNNQLIPNNGVYITTVQFDEKSYESVTNIGFRPTIDGAQFSIESHILNFDGNLYGKQIRLNFIEKIRNEHKFSSLLELIEQVHRDIEFTKKFFKKANQKMLSSK